MLHSGGEAREKMARRAVDSFESQTYKNKRLLIYTTDRENATIGQLRNSANERTDGDIILHWDDDDWSYPGRILESVLALTEGKHDCVGYNSLLFWRQCGDDPGQAWVYINGAQTYCVGTSLCYYRHVWERWPFPDMPRARGGTGEDTAWLHGVDSWAMPYNLKTPSMIAHIHGENSMPYNIEELMQHGSTNWFRLQGKDEYCRRIMQL